MNKIFTEGKLRDDDIEKLLVPALSTNRFYHGYCEDQRKAVFIILQHTHSYSKIYARHYIHRE
jgi:hypothetical protein